MRRGNQRIFLPRLIIQRVVKNSLHIIVIRTFPMQHLSLRDRPFLEMRIQLSELYAAADFRPVEPRPEPLRRRASRAVFVDQRMIIVANGEAEPIPSLLPSNPFARPRCTMPRITRRLRINAVRQKRDESI